MPGVMRVETILIRRQAIWLGCLNCSKAGITGKSEMQT